MFIVWRLSQGKHLISSIEASPFVLVDLLTLLEAFAFCKTSKNYVGGFISLFSSFYSQVNHTSVASSIRGANYFLTTVLACQLTRKCVLSILAMVR